MYWNSYIYNGVFGTHRINRNMRCIETGNEQTRKDGLQGLIETWDVLKQYNSKDVGKCVYD